MREENSVALNSLFIDVQSNYFALKVNSSRKAVLVFENYSANVHCFTILINVL